MNDRGEMSRGTGLTSTGVPFTSEPELRYSVGMDPALLLSPCPPLLASGFDSRAMSHPSSTSFSEDPGFDKRLGSLEELNRLQDLRLHPNQPDTDDDDSSLPSFSTWPTSAQGSTAGRQVYDNTHTLAGTSSTPSNSKHPVISVGVPAVTGSDKSGKGKKPAAPFEVSNSYRSHAESTQASTLPADSIKHVPLLAPSTLPSTSIPANDQSGACTLTASTPSAAGSAVSAPAQPKPRPLIHSINKKHVVAIEAFSDHFGTQLTMFDPLQNTMSTNRTRA